jgi:hypothetical protein
MGELIQTRMGLLAYLTTAQIASKNPPRSVNVSALLRRQILTGPEQGKIIHEGEGHIFRFKSIGGGVYEASLANPRKEEEADLEIARYIR